MQCVHVDAFFWHGWDGCSPLPRRKCSLHASEHLGLCPEKAAVFLGLVYIRFPVGLRGSSCHLWAHWCFGRSVLEKEPPFCACQTVNTSHDFQIHLIQSGQIWLNATGFIHKHHACCTDSCSFSRSICGKQLQKSFLPEEFEFIDVFCARRLTRGLWRS